VKWENRNVAIGANFRIGILGAVRVFEIHWNSCGVSIYGNRYKMTTLLPGFKGKTWYSETENELEAKAEELLQQWLKATTLRRMQ
jgi:hypothetical protein